MKRFHVHVSVDDLAKSIRFYSTLFATRPSVQQADYAKWMLEDPRLNFAISTRRQPEGINHLGFQPCRDGPPLQRSLSVHRQFCPQYPR